jgi:hypothetical protein
MNVSPEKMKKVMASWMACYTKSSKAIVNQGTPLGKAHAFTRKALRIL